MGSPQRSAHSPPVDVLHAPDLQLARDVLPPIYGAVLLHVIGVWCWVGVLQGLVSCGI